MNFRPAKFHGSANTIETGRESQTPEVLVVDDSQEVREAIVSLLRFAGYRSIVAENGKAAKAHLSQRLPALIVSDLRMPVCDGWNLLTYCHACYPDVPFLLISGEPLGERPEIEAWAAGFVLKPFAADKFQGEVDRLISRMVPDYAFQNTRSA